MDKKRLLLVFWLLRKVKKKAKARYNPNAKKIRG